MMRHFFIFTVLFFITISDVTAAENLWRTKPNDVFIMSQAMIDFIYEINDRKEMDHLIRDYNLNEGYSQLVNKNLVDHLQKNFKPTKKSTGGSATNTAAGLAKLGAKVTISTVIANDDLGAFYLQDLKNYNLTMLTKQRDEDGTGSVAVIISKLRQQQKEYIVRTMLVYPGISNHAKHYNIDNKVIKDHKVVFTEGYLWPTAAKEIKQLYNYAKKHHSLTAFTIGDKYIAKQHREGLMEFLPGIDIVFADLEQIMELYPAQDIKSIMVNLQKHKNIYVITMGDQGAYIVGHEELYYIPIVEVNNIVDTTGAGDQFAAGFLFKYLNNGTLEESGNFGAFQAAQIIQKKGGKP